MTLERLGAPFALQRADLERGEFTGMASVYHTLVDAFVPTRILPGAFDKTLSDPAQRRRVKILFQHDAAQPIGKPVKLEANDRGLFIHGRISKTPLGEQVLTLMRDQVLDELSIGLSADRWEMVDVGGGTTERHISELTLFEVSVVSLAANPAARITDVNARASAGDVGRQFAALEAQAAPHLATQVVGARRKSTPVVGTLCDLELGDLEGRAAALGVRLP